jgi:hypothetical protein
MSNHLATLQSIFQLSAALNATFTVIFSIYDSVLDREKKYVSGLIDSQDIIINNNNSPREIIIESKNKKAKLNDIHDKIVSKTDHISEITSDYMRPICLSAFILSIIMLGVTSFYPDDDTYTLIYVIAILTIAPFFFCFVYVVWQSLRVSSFARNAFDVVDCEPANK